MVNYFLKIYFLFYYGIHVCFYMGTCIYESWCPWGLKESLRFPEAGVICNRS